MGRRKKNPNIDVQLDPAEVGKRAYEKWMARGCIDGYAQQDWIEAEAELRAEKQRSCIVAFDVKEKKEKKVEEKPQEKLVDDVVNEYPNFPTGNGLNG